MLLYFIWCVCVVVFVVFVLRGARISAKHFHVLSHFTLTKNSMVKVTLSVLFFKRGYRRLGSWSGFHVAQLAHGGCD